MRRQVTHLLFDLDGTLTDPKEGILESIRYALAKLGWKELPTDAELMWCIGPPFRESLGKLLETDDEERIEEAVTLYRERFGSVGKFENRVYDGIPEVLTSLSGNGCELLVATSKPTFYAEQIVERFGLARFFSKIYGSEMDGTRGAKDVLLSYLLAKERLSAEQCLMIGDRMHDVLGAAANGIPCCGVTWGYGSEGELRGAGAKWVVNSPAELPIRLLGCG
jgi:phosphoglycolate phosphatase